jgi:hypothetical protein
MASKVATERLNHRLRLIWLDGYWNAAFCALVDHILFVYLTWSVIFVGIGHDMKAAGQTLMLRGCYPWHAEIIENGIIAKADAASLPNGNPVSVDFSFPINIGRAPIVKVSSLKVLLHMA